ncbi:hypothetical protein [Parvibaculum sp.]|uniref:hypothetical protein n=1 Tax=Parvibaculum sp. TaxID=2024848 RepID=UPI0034A08131
MALATIGMGFLILMAGCLLGRRWDRPGRIVIVTGAAIMLLGTLLAFLVRLADL